MRVFPLPVMAPSVPRVTTAEVNPMGVSLKVKVTVAVASEIRVEADEVMLTVGARVSMLMPGEVVNPPPLLSAASV